MKPSAPGPEAAVLILAVTLFLNAPGLAQSAGPTTTEAAPVQVTARVDPDRVTIGTPFRYTMRVEAGVEVELVVPILAERLGDFLITDFGEIPHRSEFGRTVVERWYTMVTYEAGDQLIPGVPVQYRLPGTDLQRVSAPETLVLVESLVPKDGGSVSDIKGPVAVPRDYQPLWWGLGGLALLAGAGVALFRFLNRARDARMVPPRPGHEVALEALARLASARLLEKGMHTEYYVRLSGIVRAYLEARFQLRAPEMTTEEFLQAAQRNRLLPAEHRASLSQFLSEADLVKFARYVPANEDAERAYRAARQFVESTAEAVEGPRAAA